MYKTFMQKMIAMLGFSFITGLGLGEGAGKSAEEIAEEKAMEQLGGIVEKATKKATEELKSFYEEKLAGADDTIKALQDEVSKIKAYSNSSEARKKELDNAMELATVNVFKEVMGSGQVSEKEFEAMKEAIGTKVLAEGDLTGGVTDSGAGFNVFEKFETDLIYEIEKYDIINAFKNITLAKGTKITWTIATNGITASFVDEKGMPTASEPSFSQVSINIKKVIALVTLTQELEEDQMTTPQLYRLILEFAGEAVAELLESELLGGDGTNFVGVFNLPGAKSYALGATKTATDLTEADMLLIEQKLHARDRAKASWIMSDYVRYLLYAIRDDAGNRIYPNVIDLKPTIGGRAVFVSDYGAEVQDASTNLAEKTIIAFGNLKKYLVAHRTGVTVDKGFYADNWAKEMPSIKVRKRAGMGSLDDKAFVVAETWPAS